MFQTLLPKSKSMPIAELPSGFKGGTFSPKNNSDPSPPSNWIVIIVMVSEVEPVLKYNTKRNNPKQTKQKNRNSGVPVFLVANYTSLREARRLLLNIFSPIVSCCRHGFQRRVELHCRVSNTFISHETSLSQHVAEEESRSIHNEWTQYFKTQNDLLPQQPFFPCGPLLYYFFESEVLTWSCWPLCYFNRRKTNHTEQQMDQQGIRGQPPQVSYYHTVCPYYSIWKSSRSQLWPTKLPVG